MLKLGIRSPCFRVLRLPPPTRSLAAPSLAIPHDSITSTAARPFKDMPAPRMLPGVGSILDYTVGKGQWFRKMHDVQVDRCNQLGRIFRENFAGRHLVFIADPSAAEQVFKAEPSTSQKPTMVAWIESRADLGLQAGLLSPDKEEWKRFRAPLNKITLNSKKLRHAFNDGVNEVVADFVDYLAELRTPDGAVVPDVFNEARKISMEVIGVFVYGKRLHCMEETMKPEYQDFVDSVVKILENYSTLRLSYPMHKMLKTATWKANQEGWIGSIKFNEKLAAECEDRLRKKLDNESSLDDGQYYPTCLLELMLADGALSRSGVVLNAMDLFSSGIDSVGSALSWTLHKLAGRPDVQDRLNEESLQILGPDRVKATPEELQRMPLLHNVIKEGLRISTVFPVNFRLFDHDMTLLGYNIPAKTPIGVCHHWMNYSDAFFSEPETFNPDRWTKEGMNRNFHPFSTLPFGFGMRMCPGRRITELELQVAINQICRRFRLENACDEPIGKDLAAMLIPDRPMSIRFLDRKRKCNS